MEILIKFSQVPPKMRFCNVKSGSALSVTVCHWHRWSKDYLLWINHFRTTERWNEIISCGWHSPPQYFGGSAPVHAWCIYTTPSRNHVMISRVQTQQVKCGINPIRGALRGADLYVSWLSAAAPPPLTHPLTFLSLVIRTTRWIYSNDDYAPFCPARKQTLSILRENGGLLISVASSMAVSVCILLMGLRFFFLSQKALMTFPLSVTRFS